MRHLLTLTSTLTLTLTLTLTPNQVRFHTPGYSMGVRQSVYRRYNETAGFFLRDLRGDTDVGKHPNPKPNPNLKP